LSLQLGGRTGGLNFFKQYCKTFWPPGIPATVLGQVVVITEYKQTSRRIQFTPEALKRLLNVCFVLEFTFKSWELRERRARFWAGAGENGVARQRT